MLLWHEGSSGIPGYVHNQAPRTALCVRHAIRFGLSLNRSMRLGEKVFNAR